MPRPDILIPLARALYGFFRQASARTGYQTLTPPLGFDQLPDVHKRIWIEAADDFAAFIRSQPNVAA